MASYSDTYEGEIRRLVSDMLISENVKDRIIDELVNNFDEITDGMYETKLPLPEDTRLSYDVRNAKRPFCFQCFIPPAEDIYNEEDYVFRINFICTTEERLKKIIEFDVEFQGGLFSNSAEEITQFILPTDIDRRDIFKDELKEMVKQQDHYLISLVNIPAYVSYLCEDDEAISAELDCKYNTTSNVKGLFFGVYDTYVEYETHSAFR